MVKGVRPKAYKKNLGSGNDSLSPDFPRSNHLEYGYIYIVEILLTENAIILLDVESRNLIENAGVETRLTSNRSNRMIPQSKTPWPTQNLTRISKRIRILHALNRKPE